MKKRLLCLFLGLMMVLSVALTACSTDEDADADVEITNAQTITMRLISELKVCNTDEELAAYLANECGGDKESQKYLDMVETKAAYDAVEAAFTKVTKSKFKVNVDLIFYTEDEYFDLLEVTMDRYALESKNAERAARALEKYISDYQAAYPDADYPEKRLAEEFFKLFPEYAQYKDKINVGADEEEDGENKVVEEQYKENDMGIKELVYPATEPNQLDIIYLSGLDMYNKYIENEWLQVLNDYINTTGKKLNDYITGALLNGVQSNGQIYGIPNNVQIGEYTYMLVDKELFDRYYYNKEEVHDVLDLKNFLHDVNNSEPGILPIDASFKDCMDQFVWYWDIDKTEDDETGEAVYNISNRNEFSMIGALYGDPASAGRGQIQLGFNNLFTLPEYREIFLDLKEFEYNNFYAGEDETRTDAAVSFVKGNYEIKYYIDKAIKENDGKHTAGVVNKNGKDYYAYVIKYPEVDEDSLYGNMFGISANSSRTQACMQVLTLLNTNSELRNILQYGVEGVNYVINEDTGKLERLNRKYLMDIEKTGNCFIAHPEEGLGATYWEFAKKQNNDALINPLLGFNFNTMLAEYSAVLDDNQWDLQKQYGQQVLERVADCGDFEELEDLVEDYGSSLKSDPYLKIAGQEDKWVRLSKLTNPLYDTATSGNPDDPKVDSDGESPYAMYYKWMISYNFLPN